MTRAQAIAAAMVFRNKQAALEHEGRATLPPAPETATAKQHLPLAGSGWRINGGPQHRMAAFLGSLAIQGSLA